MTAPSPKEALELKPCPFCGKQPQSRWHGAIGEDDDSGYWGIDCCQAFSHDGIQEDAVNKWNTRAALATLQPSGERREAIARIAYEGRHKGLSNCWKWGDAELDHEHPGSRDMYYAIADTLIASGLVQDEAVWRDISTAPKDKIDGILAHRVLLANTHGSMFIGYWSAEHDCWQDTSTHERVFSVATHWMPLPAPPIRSARNGGE